MISTSDISNGVNFKLEGEIYTVVWFQHHKPGKGGAVVRLKIKNLRTGSTIERTVRSGEKFEEVNLEHKRMQYLYNDGEAYVFMDNTSYEQVSIDKSHLGENLKFLKDSMEVDVLYYGDEILGIELPNSVEMRITYTEKGIKGDTISGATKPATIETGAVIQVPLFIEIDDVVKIDTRTGSYVQRV